MGCILLLTHQKTSGLAGFVLSWFSFRITRPEQWAEEMLRPTSLLLWLGGPLAAILYEIGQDFPPLGLNKGAYPFLQAKARVAACQLQLILSSVLGGTMSTQHSSLVVFPLKNGEKITVGMLLKATAAIFSHCFRRTSVRWRGSFHCHLWLLLYHTCWICLGSLLACSGRFGFLNWVKEKKSLKFYVRQYNCHCQEFCKGQEK